jgi:hypothetical protein
MGERRIDGLSGIEFRGAKDITIYSRSAREVCKDLSMEFDAAAEQVLAVLSRQHGHPLLFGIDVKVRARKVSKRLRIASELIHGAGVEVVKFNSEFRYQFANAIKPSRALARTFNWEDD